MTGVYAWCVCRKDVHEEYVRVECTDSVCLERLRTAMIDPSCVMGARVWDGGHIHDAVGLMIDSGASTHMKNDRCVLEHGTVVCCCVRERSCVQGLFMSRRSS